MKNIKIETIAENVISSILYLLIFVLSAFIIIYIFQRRELKQDNKSGDIITLKNIAYGMLKNFVKGHIEAEAYDESTRNEEYKISSNKEKNAPNISETLKIKRYFEYDIPQDSSVELRKSKDYGEDSYFSIRTWFGVNLNKLYKEKYQYICFKIIDKDKDEDGEFYFSINDFFEIINKAITKDEKGKYEKRNSLDTYLMKSKKDEKWYITRLGTPLQKYIEITGDN